MRLLAENAVELEIADADSAMTVQRSLKNRLRPHLSAYWKIPPDGNAAFVAAMEDVLEVYHLPYDPNLTSCGRSQGEVRRTPPDPFQDRRSERFNPPPCGCG